MDSGPELFRSRALASRRERWFGPVAVVTPPSLAVSVAIALAALVLLLSALVVVEIPDRVRAFGIVVPVSGLLKIRAQRPGRVQDLAVGNGDPVVAGQVLMRLSGLQRAPGREPEVAQRIASLRRELELDERAAAQQLQGFEQRSSANARRLELTGQRIAAAELELRTRRQQAALFANRAERVSELAGMQLVSAQTADELSAAALQARAAGETALQQVLLLRDERLRIEQQVQQDETLAQVMRSEADARRETLLRQVAAGELQSAVEIVAPGAGVVAGLAVRQDDEVVASQVLLTLHDPGVPLEARLYVSPDSAGMIEAGQSVELQLEAYPHQRYGTRTAVVRSVSAAAIAAEEFGRNLPLRGPVFEIRASLGEPVVHARGVAWPLRPGTSFNADLVRRRWPLYRWLLRGATEAPVN